MYEVIINQAQGLMLSRIIVQAPTIQGLIIIQHKATLTPIQAVRDTKARIVHTGAGSLNTAQDQKPYLH